MNNHPEFMLELEDTNCEKWETHANNLNLVELQNMIDTGFSINSLIEDELHLVTLFMNKHMQNQEFFNFLIQHKEKIDWFVRSKSLPITPMFTLLCDDNLTDLQRYELVSSVPESEIVEYIKTLEPNYTLSQKSTLKNLIYYFNKYEEELQETISLFKNTHDEFKTISEYEESMKEKEHLQSLIKNEFDLYLSK